MTNPLDDLAQAAAASTRRPPAARQPTQTPAAISYAAAPARETPNRIKIRDGFFFGVGFWLAGLAFTFCTWLLVMIVAGIGLASCSLVGRSASPAPTYPPPSPFYHR